MRRLWVAALVATAITAWPVLPSGSARRCASGASPAATSDFNGDGRCDLAIAVIGETVADQFRAGAVNVLYGSDDGLTGRASQLWSQDSPGIAGAARADEYFGGGLVAGDFDGDGYGDLAVGVPGDDPDGLDGAGALNVIYGSDDGLTSGRNQLWHQESPAVAGTAEESDAFGAELQAGDFDGDGYTDVAVAVPGDGPERIKGAGAVNVISGSARGLTGTDSQLWHQDSPNIEGEAQSGDGFGESLGAGDLNGDGYADLVIGVPAETVGPSVGAGAVNVLYGSTDGLGSGANQQWHQDSPEIEGTAGEREDFGAAITVGDFNHDGYADVAIDIGLDDIPGVDAAGTVEVIFGSPWGLTGADDQLWSQDSPDIEGTAEEYDGWGAGLTGGDYNGDGFADLAVGSPAEPVGDALFAGSVNVLYGSEAALTAAGNQAWSQDRPGIEDQAEGHDQFGQRLAAGDFDGDGYDDLVVAGPYETHGPLDEAGAITVIYGSPRGLAAAGDQFWHQDSPGVPGDVNPQDTFGFGLAASGRTGAVAPGP